MNDLHINIIYHDLLFCEAMKIELESKGIRVAAAWHYEEMEADAERLLETDLLLIQAPTASTSVAAILKAATTAERRRPRVIVLSTGASHADMLDLARDGGADAFIDSSMPLAAFLECLRLVSYGVQIFPPGPARSRRHPARCDVVLADPGEAVMAIGVALETLSPREIDIVLALRDGLSNKMIARRLNISESTVKTHLKAILRKVGAANRTQAAIWAIENHQHITHAA